MTGGRRAGGASPAGIAAAAALALLAGGCGGEAGDLMLVRRSGDIPGARLSLRFTEDGRVGCDREALRQLTSPQTIAVRDLHRRFAGDERPGPATRHLRLAPGPGSGVELAIVTVSVNVVPCGVAVLTVTSTNTTVL